MVHIFLLIWFIVTPAGNQIMLKQFDSKQECQAFGDLMEMDSAEAQAAKKMTTYGGTCYEVQNSDNGST